MLGARPLRRTIQREIEDALSEKILFGELRAGHIVIVDTEGEGDEVKFTFTGVPKPETVPAEAAVAAVAASEPATPPANTGGGSAASEGPGTAQAIG